MLDFLSQRISGPGTENQCGSKVSPIEGQIEFLRRMNCSRGSLPPRGRWLIPGATASLSP